MQFYQDDDDNDSQFFGAIKVKDGIFIGDQYASKDLDFIITNKISRVLNCASSETDNMWISQGVEYLSIPWIENDNQILFDQHNEIVDKIYDFMENAHQLGESVLVHSIRGQSRACCALACYFMLKFRWTLYKTLEYLNSRRHDLEIRAIFFHQLTALEEKFKQMGYGARSNTWNEVGTNDAEELLIRNTFLNAKNNPLEEAYSNKSFNQVQKKTKILWQDEKLKKKLEYYVDEVAVAKMHNFQDKPFFKSVLKGSKKEFQIMQNDYKLLNLQIKNSQSFKNLDTLQQQQSTINRSVSMNNLNKQQQQTQIKQDQNKQNNENKQNQNQQQEQDNKPKSIQNQDQSKQKQTPSQQINHEKQQIELYNSMMRKEYQESQQTSQNQKPDLKYNNFTNSQENDVNKSQLKQNHKKANSIKNMEDNSKNIQMDLMINDKLQSLNSRTTALQSQQSKSPLEKISIDLDKNKIKQNDKQQRPQSVQLFEREKFSQELDAFDLQIQRLNIEPIKQDKKIVLRTNSVPKDLEIQKEPSYPQQAKQRLRQDSPIYGIKTKKSTSQQNTQQFKSQIRPKSSILQNQNEINSQNFNKSLNYKSLNDRKNSSHDRLSIYMNSTKPLQNNQNVDNLIASVGNTSMSTKNYNSMQPSSTFLNKNGPIRANYDLIKTNKNDESINQQQNMRKSQSSVQVQYDSRKTELRAPSPTSQGMNNKLQSKSNDFTNHLRSKLRSNSPGVSKRQDLINNQNIFLASNIQTHQTQSFIKPLWKN